MIKLAEPEGLSGQRDNREWWNQRKYWRRYGGFGGTIGIIGNGGISENGGISGSIGEGMAVLVVDCER